MKRLQICMAVFCLLALTVPWFFAGRTVPDVAGVPAWAVYATVLMMIYPAATAWILRRYWAAFEEPAQWHRDRNPPGSPSDRDAGHG